MCADKNTCGGGTCGAESKSCGSQEGCGGGSRHHSFMKKVLMMLIIITLVFWMGVRFGMMSGEIRAYKGGWSQSNMMNKNWDAKQMMQTESAGETTQNPASN